MFGWSLSEQTAPFPPAAFQFLSHNNISRDSVWLRKLTKAFTLRHARRPFYLRTQRDHVIKHMEAIFVAQSEEGRLNPTFL